MAGGAGHGGGSISMSADTLNAYNGANASAPSAAPPGGSSGGKGTSQASASDAPPPPVLPDHNPAMFANGPGPSSKGTSGAAPSSAPPPPAMNASMGQQPGNDWYSNLMQNIAMQQMQQPRVQPYQAPSYAEMTKQALPNGWQKPAEPVKKEETAAAAPKPDEMQTMRDQLAALQKQAEDERIQRENAWRYQGPMPSYATGGAAHSPHDEIVKHALAMLRSNSR